MQTTTTAITSLVSAPDTPSYLPLCLPSTVNKALTGKDFPFPTAPAAVPTYSTHAWDYTARQDERDAHQHDLTLYYNQIYIDSALRHFLLRIIPRDLLPLSFTNNSLNGSILWPSN